MRRKSERNKNKSSPEKKTVETPQPVRKSKRHSRKQRSPSPEESDHDVKRSSSPKEAETPTSKSPSNSDDEGATAVTEKPIWKVQTASTDSSSGGELQKIKICLTRPIPTTPERREKSPRRKRHKSASTHDDCEERRESRKSRRRGSPAVATLSGMEDSQSQESQESQQEEHEGKFIKDRQAQEQHEILGTESVHATSEPVQAQMYTLMQNEPKIEESVTDVKKTESPVDVHQNEGIHKVETKEIIEEATSEEKQDIEEEKVNESDVNETKSESNETTKVTVDIESQLQEKAIETLPTEEHKTDEGEKKKVEMKLEQPEKEQVECGEQTTSSVIDTKSEEKIEVNEVAMEQISEKEIPPIIVAVDVPDTKLNQKPVEEEIAVVTIEENQIKESITVITNETDEKMDTSEVSAKEETEIEKSVTVISNEKDEKTATTKESEKKVAEVKEIPIISEEQHTKEEVEEQKASRNELSPSVSIEKEEHKIVPNKKENTIEFTTKIESVEEKEEMLKEKTPPRETATTCDPDSSASTEFTTKKESGKEKEKMLKEKTPPRETATSCDPDSSASTEVITKKENEKTLEEKTAPTETATSCDPDSSASTEVITKKENEKTLVEKTAPTETATSCDPDSSASTEFTTKKESVKENEKICKEKTPPRKAAISCDPDSSASTEFTKNKEGVKEDEGRDKKICKEKTPPRKTIVSRESSDSSSSSESSDNEDDEQPVNKKQKKVEGPKIAHEPAVELQTKHTDVVPETVDKTSETISVAEKKIKRKWSMGVNNIPQITIITSKTIRTICPDVEVLTEDQLRLEVRSKKSEKQHSTPFERKVSIEHRLEKKDSARAVADEDSITTNIISFNRKISIVDDEASKLQPPPQPAKNPVSSVLYITNLVRPFTLKQLKELLCRTGVIVDNGFWTDRIKSKCYVQYGNEEDAEATRNALHGVQWPIGNGKQLDIDYASVEKMEAAKNAVVEEAATAVAKIPPIEKENFVPLPIEEDKKKEHLGKEPPAVPVREWDLGKIDYEKEKWRSNSKDRHVSESKDRDSGRKRRHSRHSSPIDDTLNRKQQKKDEEVPAKLMDDLFHKTVTTPSIYWLPLTPEQIATKQQERLERMAEHKRRMEESRGRGDFGRGGTFRRR